MVTKIKSEESMLEIAQFVCLSDNYGYLVHDPKTGSTASIDAPDAEPINAELDRRGWSLTHVLVTHHHFDHTAGNEALKDRWSCEIVGSRSDAGRIPAIEKQVEHGELFQFGGYDVEVIEVSGHTVGHIAYFFKEEKHAFVGDTLFALGCGRLFEGSAEQMWQSLSRLCELPDDTLIYCGHEYTESNAKFAITIEPENELLVKRVDEITALRSKDQPTVPSYLGLEKKTNPFLRPHVREVQRFLAMEGCDVVDIFSEIRKRKDNF